MAIKRSFSVKDNKGRACLKCGRTLPLEQMKDDTICACVCGQKMFVDRYDSRAVLTVYERPELRKRLGGATQRRQGHRDRKVKSAACSSKAGRKGMGSGSRRTGAHDRGNESTNEGMTTNDAMQKEQKKIATNGNL